MRRLVLFFLLFLPQAWAAAPPIPRPIVIWPANPFEVRIAFDQKLDPAVVRNLKDVAIDFCEADLNLKLSSPTKLPPSFQDPNATIIGHLPVADMKLASNLRTLILATDPHPLAVNYALTLPGIRASGQKTEPETLHLRYSLHGVEASWYANQKPASPVWTAWLPALDTTVSLTQLAGTMEQQEVAQALQRPGRLVLKTLVQPVASASKVRLASNTPFQITLDNHSIQAQPSVGGLLCAEINLPPGSDYQVLAMTLPTSRTPPPASIHTEYRDTSNPPRFLVPWAPPMRLAPGRRWPTPALTGGDFLRGQELFRGNQLKCASCHRLRGEGGLVGPDLSNQALRDPAAILNDIVNPSDRLNPNYVSFNLSLREGVDLTAFVHLQKNNTLQIIESDGKTNTVKRTEIQSIRASAVSLMPTGLLDMMSADQIRDLLTFLVKPSAK